MAFHFSDPPGETLPSRRESIDGTADGEVTEVQVVYDGELVYTKDSGFSPLYATSTLSADKKSLDVRRTGGWRRPFDLVVEEKSVDPSAQDWGVVGAVDFSTLPNASLVAGANTVGGVSIYVKGAAYGIGDGVAVVNGSGLRQTRLTANTLTSALGGNAGIIDTLIYAPFDQFANYRPGAPVAVQFRWNDLPTAYPSNLIGSAGMLACAKSAAAVTSAENGSQQSTAWTYFSPGDNLTNRTQYFWKNSGTSSANQRVAAGIAGNAAANAQQATHVYTRAGRVGVCYHDAWGGSFADLQDMSFANARLYPAVEGSPLAPSFGFFMYFSNAVGPSFGSQYATMRSMRVLQPRG